MNLTSDFGEQCEPNTRPTFGWKANVQKGSVTLTLRKIMQQQRGSRSLSR